MAWDKLADDAGGRTGAPQAAMSLLTLSLRAGVCASEIDFYAEAERSALREWSRKGYILLALQTIDFDEMMIVCPYDRTVIMPMAEVLPYVVADIASYRVQAVSAANFVSTRLG